MLEPQNWKTTITLRQKIQEGPILLAEKDLQPCYTIPTEHQAAGWGKEYF